MITDTSAKIRGGDKEPLADKYFISFPENEVLENCTLCVVEGNTFVLIWDSDQDEYDSMLDYYFEQLQPFLKKNQAVKGYYRGKNVDLSILDYDVRSKLEHYHNYKSFAGWYEGHTDTDMRKLGWKRLLQAKSVITVRPTTSRTVSKAQGISTKILLLAEDSYYGCSVDGQYVGCSRAMNGIILVKNVPNDWKS